MEGYRAQDSSRWTIIGVRKGSAGDTTAEVLHGPALPSGEKVEVVPAEQLRRVVEAIRKHVDTVMPRDGSTVDMSTVAASCERLWMAVHPDGGR